MAAGAAERISWAVAQLRLRPHQRVLEVGCGHGVAVSVMCGDYGVTVLAIDRSAKMIAAARQRNARFAAGGQAVFAQTALAQAELGSETFDRVLAIHVPVLLRGDPARELAVIRACLAKDGELHVSSQPPHGTDINAEIAHISVALTANGFRIDRVVEAELGGGRAFSVIGVRGPDDSG